MIVTVEHVTEQPDVVLVDVEIGGVDDAEGAAAFRLVVPGRCCSPTPPPATTAGPRPSQAQPCTLAFRLADDAGSSRVLLYQRGDERVRWDLATIDGEDVTPSPPAEDRASDRPALR